jgi:hypothetical protein
MKLVGVDMVYLSAKPDEYRVRTLKGFNHNRGNLPYGEDPQPWGMSADGEPMSGRLNLNWGKGGHIATTDLSSHGLLIQFNPSKILHPFELNTDPAKLSDVVDQVKTLLHDLTIDVDIDRMKLFRVDLAKQAVMNQPVQAFTFAFSAIQGKRMSNRIQYPDGFEVGNKSRMSVFYDKYTERMKAGVTGVPENLLRNECRWTGKAVGNVNIGLGIGTLHDLRTSDPEYLTDRYNRFLLADVFRTGDGHQMTIEFGTEADILANLVQEYGVSMGIRKYVGWNGLDSLVTTFGGPDGLRKLLMNIGVKRRTAYNMAGNIRQQMDLNRFLDQYRKDKKDTTASALDTLIRTFAA